MKRTPRPKKPLIGMRMDAVLLNFTPEQLIGIGAVAMAFNDAERALHELLGPCVQPLPYEVVATRINGMDGIAAIIRAGAKVLIQAHSDKADLAQNIQKDIGLSLDAFLEAKKFRDGVIHANIFDQPTGVGHQRARDTIYEVLLETNALVWLADTCLVLAEELRAWRDALAASSKLRLAHEDDDQARSLHEEAFLTATSQAQSYRPRRVSLGPVPKFPDPL